MRLEFKNLWRSTILLAMFMLSGQWLFAQLIEINGKITDAATGGALSGVSIIKKGGKSAVSGSDGGFAIKAAKDDFLEVSYVGYSTQKVKVSGSILNIALAINHKELNEVVVTALGIKKEKKKLGYSVQEVVGSDLVKAREPNAINGLVGKVAGLTVGINSELLASPNLLLRGSGINLYVVDGVPINSDTWNISPDDIETYTVLKGATASALYGSRGLNGAIMITTKRGSKNKRGFSIEYNSSTMMEKGFNAIPKVQDEYGPGDHGKYAFVDGRGGGTNDADYDVWGPKFEGQLIPQYDSPVDPATGVRARTPWVSRGKNNLKRFLNAGILSTNNIAVSSKTEKADLRFSFTNTYQRGLVPNTKLNAVNFNISAGYNFTDNLRLEGYLNYNRQFTKNIPDVAYGPNSIIYNIEIWAGADWDIDDMRNYWQPGKEGQQSIFAEYQRYHNPYFMSYEWLRGHYKTDVNGYAKLSYKLSKNVDFLVRSQFTTYDLFRNEKMPFSAHPYGREEGKGDYREDRRSLFENNTDALITYSNNNIFNKISLKTSLGGNIRSFQYNSSYATTDYLNESGLYVLGNSRDQAKVSSYSAPMIVLSTYGYMDIGFSKYANISLTGRVDKHSTLPKGRQVSFYPSASLSTVVSDYVELPEAISFLKLRTSLANVKGGLTTATIGSTPLGGFPVGYGVNYSSSYDGPTFENSDTYSIPFIYDNKAGAYYTSTISNNRIRPFSSEVSELGFDVRFIKNRLALEATYFSTKDGPGIFKLPVSAASGFSEALENGITTKKTGFELSLSGSAIKSKIATGFNWNVLANWSTFKEKYTSFYPGVDRISTFLKVGDRVDKLYGSAFVRTPDGQLINDDGGKPLKAPVAQHLGNMNPAWVWSVNNSFRYKNFNLSFQFDGRVGGKMINYIQQQTFRGGRHIATVQGAMGDARYQDYKGTKSWVGNGVALKAGNPAITYDADGKVTNYKDLQYVPNTAKTFLQDYISFYYNTNEGNLISKTFAKLREVVVGYSFPQSMLGNSFIQQATVSFVARNLMYFSKHKDLDLDQYPGRNASSSLQTPTTKRYGININITF